MCTACGQDVYIFGWNFFLCQWIHKCSGLWWEMHFVLWITVKKFFEYHWVRRPEFWCQLYQCFFSCPRPSQPFRISFPSMKCILLTWTFGEKQSTLFSSWSLIILTLANIYWTFESTVISCVIYFKAKNNHMKAIYFDCPYFTDKVRLREAK